MSERHRLADQLLLGAPSAPVSPPRTTTAHGRATPCSMDDAGLKKVQLPNQLAGCLIVDPAQPGLFENLLTLGLHAREPQALLGFGKTPALARAIRRSSAALQAVPVQRQHVIGGFSIEVASSPLRESRS